MHRSGVQARVLARSRTCPVQVRGRGRPRVCQRHPEQHTPRAEHADSAAPPFIRFVLFLKVKTDQVSERAPRKRAAPRLRPVVLEAPEAVAQAPRLGPGPPEGPACAGCPPGTDPHPQLPPLSVAAPRSSLASSLACQLKTEVTQVTQFRPAHLLVCLSLSVPSRFTLQNLHQLKQIQTLKQMNEQLQAENRALARVVARLSRSAETSETQEL